MRDHRSLEAWQEARRLSLDALDAGRDHWKPWAAALFEQLQRAALSIQLNIAEGYALGTQRTFAHHLRIAYGSAVETGELLELASERNLIPPEQVTESAERCARGQRLLHGLLKRYRPGVH